MSYLYMLLDIVSSLLILVTFTFAVSVKDKANKKRECEEITENEIIILSNNSSNTFLSYKTKK